MQLTYTPLAKSIKSNMHKLAIGGLALGLSTGAMAANPYNVENDSWIGVEGTVADARPSSFDLDFGEGMVTVEMDDWDWYKEGRALIEGDQVTVYGRIDDGLYEKRTIEAGSVYVDDLNTSFFANPVDEEAASSLYVATSYLVPLKDGDEVTINGIVDSVDGREFTLDTGSAHVQVDTITMNYNPMDDKGYQKVDEGDVVSISGELDLDFFEENEIQANSIVTLTPENRS